MSNTHNRCAAALAAIVLPFGLAEAAAMDRVVAQSETAQAAEAIEIRDFVGKLIFVPDEAAVSARLSDAVEGGPIVITANGAALRIDGPKELVRQVERQVQHGRIGDRRNSKERFEDFLSNYPVLTLSLPSTVDLILRDSAVLIDGEAADFDDVQIVDVPILYGAIGASRRADIHVSGRSDLEIGDVAERLKADVSGAGDLVGEVVGDAILRISGSGDLTLSDVRGRLEARISGAGDIEIDDVAGGADVHVSGSGDVSLDDITGAFRATVSGSGDVEADRIEGPVEIRISGSGDIEIDEGDASAFSVEASGSGNVHFGGIATDPIVAVNGSSDIRIDAYRGTPQVNGRRGSVRIGGERFPRDTAGQ